MKKIFILKSVFFLIGHFCAHAQLLNFGLAKKLGGTAYDYGQAIARDASGNLYTTGLFQGTADFDPGSGTQNLTSMGGGDVFISKLDVSGNYVWAKQIGGTLGERAYGITTDASGNVYITGYFEDVVDFNPSPVGVFPLTSFGQTDIFVCKFDASGNFIWAKQIGGAGHDYAFSIALDAAGNVYTSGKFYGTCDFDPDASTYNLSSNLGTEDAFISCLNTSGNFVSAFRIGGTFNDNAQSIVFDATGNLLVTGYFQGTMDADPGAGVANLISAGNRDVFVAKFTNTGGYVWAKSWGGLLADEGWDVAADASGNIYTTGLYQGTVDFDPSAAVYNAVSNGGYDVFVSRLDASGNFVWTGSAGGPLNDKGNSVALSSDAVYFTGYFQGASDFDPGAGVTSLTSSGGQDIFVASLTYSGSFRQAQQMGGVSDDEAAALLVNTDSMYITGYFQSTADFDPQASTYALTSSGSFDIFVNKLILSAPLPVKLFSFTASPEKDGQVVVQWEATCETDNCVFWVERSARSSDWELVYSVAGNANSAPIQYTIIDSNPFSGVSYYRLKQTSERSGDLYSSIIAVNVNEDVVGFTVYPNPAASAIQIVSSANEPMDIAIYTSAGLLVQRHRVHGDAPIDISSLPPNTYRLSLTTKHRSSTLNLIKY